MTLTKSWLQKQITDLETTRDDPWLGLDEDGNNTLAALKLALAGMESEPVGEVSEQRDGLVLDGTVDLGGTTTHRIIKGASKMKRLPLGTKFYTAPQPLTISERAELENYRNAQQHPAATLYNGSGRVSVMMVSDLPAGEVDVYTTPQPVPVAHDNFMMPPRIENIELRSPLEVEDMWRARVRHMFRAAGLKLHEDESK